MSQVPDWGEFDFLAIDVETANADSSSICQIGLVACHQGVVTEQWGALIDPRDYFNPFNTNHIHHIQECDVAGAPTFAEVHGDLAQLVEQSILVCHSPFDKTAISKACHDQSLKTLQPIWLDSLRVAKRAWPEWSEHGYGLGVVAKQLGIEFKHHDATEDARAAAEIVLAAIDQTGRPISEWLQRVERPVVDYERPTANSEGPMCGETVVFTGTLSMKRKEAQSMVADAGGTNGKSDPTKKTTLVVVGEQDVRQLAGKDKSDSHIRAEELIEQGHPIQIVSEETFLHLLSSSDSSQG